MRKTIFNAVMGMLALGTVAAHAAPITGVLNLSGNGGVTFDINQMTFNDSGLGNVTYGNQTGSFSSLAQCFNCVTFGSPSTMSGTNIFSFDPLGSGSSAVVYTLTDGDITSTLTLTSVTRSGQGSSGNYSLEGNGILTLTGYDPTTGIFDLTTQGGMGALASFSATSLASASMAVPEPTSMALLGAGLFGIGMLRNRRVRQG